MATDAKQSVAERVFSRFGVQSYAKLDAAAADIGDGGNGRDEGGHTSMFQGRQQQSIVAKALHLWVTPFLKLGVERTLELDDLLPLPKDYLASTNSRRFETLLARAMEREEARLAEEKEWAGLGKKSRGPLLPAVVWPLWSCFGATILTGSFFKLCNDLIQFLPAVILGGFLRYIAGKDHFMADLNADDNTYGALYCLLLFLVPVARTLCEQTYFYYAQASGICIKGALATAVYRKTMRLSAAGRGTIQFTHYNCHIQQQENQTNNFFFFLKSRKQAPSLPGTVSYFIPV